MKRIFLYLTATALMGVFACYLPIEIQCTADADCLGGATCVNSRCACPAARATACGTNRTTFKCVDTNTDNSHCGTCDKQCTTSQFCGQGTCENCDPSTGGKTCNGQCVNIATDPNNCGDCGIVCKNGQTCTKKSGVVAGECQCPTGEKLCDKCVNLQTDAANCGGCGTKCPSGQICSAGKCAVCPDTPAQPNCNGACPILASDAKHCGACGNACAAGEECCNGKCVDPTKAYTTATDCGACGNACGGDNSCGEDPDNKGKFKCVCKDTKLTSCESKCVDLSSDPKFCGSCNTKCDEGKGEICSAAKCCGAGEKTCNEQCKAIQTDPDNCGDCGNSCGAQICKAGKCTDCTSDADCGGGLSCANKACICGPKCGWVFSTANFSKTSASAVIQGRGVVVDKAGNTYVTGSIRGVVQFAEDVDPPTTAGGEDIFVLKLNPKGLLVWVKVFGGKDPDQGNAIALSTDEKTVLIAGSYSDEVIFAPNATPPIKLKSEGSTDAFVLALDDKGEVQYAIGGGSAGFDEANGIAVANANQAYITGKTNDGAKFSGTTITANGSTNIPLVARLDLTTKTFDKAIGLDSKGSVGHAVASTSTGDVFVTGECATTIPWKAAADLCKNGGMMILRFDKDLVESAEGVATQGTSVGRAIVLDGSTPNVAGYFDQSVLFEKAFASMGADVMVTQMSGAAFANTTQGSDPNNADVDGDAFGIALVNKNRFIAGSLGNQLNFGTNKLTTVGKSDIFVAELDDQHQWKWSISAGSEADDRALAIATDTQGGLVVTGYFSGEVKNFKTSAGAITLKNKASQELFVWKVPYP